MLYSYLTACLPQLINHWVTNRVLYLVINTYIRNHYSGGRQAAKMVLIDETDLLHIR